MNEKFSTNVFQSFKQTVSFFAYSKAPSLLYRPYLSSILSFHTLHS